MNSLARQHLSKGLLISAAATFSLCLFVLLFLVHRIAFEAPFYFDSVSHLENKTHLHMAEVSIRSVSDAIHFQAHGGRLYRPVANLSLAFTFRFAGLTPRAYRIGNLLIHWAACLGLFFLFLSVMRTPKVERSFRVDRKTGYAIAVAGVLLWGLHPIQTNVVTYVIQRMASLSGLFTFLCLGCYLRARTAKEGWGWGWGVSSFAFFLLAFGSKENALVCLPLVLLSEFVILDPPTSVSTRKVLRWISWGLALLGCVALVWKGPWLFRTLSTVADARSFSLWQRLLTELAIQARYLTVLMVPDPRLLTLDANIEVIHSVFSSASTAARVLFPLVVLAFGLWQCRRRPLLGFGILWFFAAQLVESTILPLELYYEHRMYVPSVFFFLGIAHLICWPKQVIPHFERFAVALLCLALVAESWATVSRNRVWADPLVFWLDAVSKAPTKPRVWTNASRELIQQELYDEGIKVGKEALKLGAEPSGVFLNLATAEYKRGFPEKAKRYLERALEEGNGTKLHLVHRNLAKLFIEAGDLPQARSHLEEALRTNRKDSASWALLGKTSILEKNFEQAEQELLHAIRYDPAHVNAWNDLGVVYYRQGDCEKASSYLEKALRYQPKNTLYKTNYEEAIRCSKKPDVK